MNSSIQFHTVCCYYVFQRSGASRMCVFRETLSANHFTELQSVCDATWRIGFKRNGRPMSFRHDVGQQRRRRRRRQRCVQFLKHGAEMRFNWHRLRPSLGQIDRQLIVQSQLRRRRRRRRV